MKKLLLAGLLVLAPQLALAEDEGIQAGMRLLRDCKALDNEDDMSWMNGFQGGFCFGVINTWALEIAHSQDFNDDICKPSGVTVGQARMVFIRYAEKHPERLHENFHTLIKDSFKEAWPC